MKNPTHGKVALTRCYFCGKRLREGDRVDTVVGWRTIVNGKTGNVSRVSHKEGDKRCKVAK